MIKYLKRNELNIEKYNSCISNSKNSRIYSYSWYLDCVADNWDALVLNNYEAVMPLPWRKKYLIKYIYLPIWIQQLGVFSEKEISQNLTEEFIKSIPIKFKKITIPFNSENKLHINSIDNTCNNFVLKLNKSYVELYAKFNSNRKRALKKSKKVSIAIDERLTSIEFLKFYSEYSKFESNKPKILKLKKLLELNQSKLIGIRIEGEIETVLLYFADSKRITYLLPVSTKKGKFCGLPTLLITHLLKQYQSSNLVFDFEGSMVKGVAGFYKSFGSSKETYTLFKSNFLHFF